MAPRAGRTHPVHGVAQALELLGRLPGGPELLRQTRRREDVALVGGAVRDLLLEHWPREIDVTVEDDAAGLAHELAASISPSERAYGRSVEPVVHDRFGTASLAWGYGRIDIARRRAESYPAPGALPEVRPGTIEEDLTRRDFTVNAMTVPLAGPRRGELLTVEHALDDLKHGLLRVLHDQSFTDDPTRLLRLARYAARLRFDIEPHTRELAGQAVAQGALATVSGGRIGAELWLAAGEESGPGALRILDELGVLKAIGMTSSFDADLVRSALALLPADGSRDVVLLGVALRPAELGADSAGTVEVMRALEFTSAETKAVFDAANQPPKLAQTLIAPPQPSSPWFALDETSPEVVAIAGALAARSSEQAQALVQEWFDRRRHIHLDIDGNDLVAAGAPGLKIGLALKLTLSRKRAAEISGREEELRTALALIEEGTWIETC